MKDSNKLSAPSEGILMKMMCRRIFRIVCRLQINIVIEKYINGGNGLFIVSFVAWQV